MDFIGLGGYNLRGLSKKNVLLGKNGCGKSYLLKQVEQPLQEAIGKVRYLSPERGGVLRWDANVEENILRTPQFLGESRRRNQSADFRQQSAVQLRRLELLVLREIENNPDARSDLSVTFDVALASINKLLDRVYIERGDPLFQIRNRESNSLVEPWDISSGESELITLGIECLVFEKECVAGQMNILLMDEPDVHLHPDLQARFARFLDRLVSSDRMSVLIATHSTALLGAMSEDDHTRVAFMHYGDTNITFWPTTGILRRILPVFGAHPLSNVFNQAPCAVSGRRR